MLDFILKFDRFRLELGPCACIMGILNATPDSFSDGGRYHTLETALAQGRNLAKAGAHILDIGGESSRPFAQAVPEQEELDRVIPVIETLAREIDIPISIDTVKSRVARVALDAGATIINDISAFEKDPAMADLAAEKKVPCVLMHMKGTPENMQVNPNYEDLMEEITIYLDARARFARGRGIARDKIILDPGIGFGKTIEHNLMILNHLHKICDLGYPVLMGPSRKSFIQAVLNKQETTPIGPDNIKTEYGTLAAVAASILKGAHIVRVHDVERIISFTRILDAIRHA